MQDKYDGIINRRVFVSESNVLTKEGYSDYFLNMP